MQTDGQLGAMQADVAKLVGCKLTDIRVRTFCVEFVFADALSITVRVKKAFKFLLGGETESGFDPAVLTHDQSAERAEFVFLRGMRCRDATLNRSKLEVVFENSWRLWVELGDKDFEPLELIGATGERHEKMDFYYVL